MRDLTPENFNMVVKPVPGRTEDVYDSIGAWAGENFFVPSQAAIHRWVGISTLSHVQGKRRSGLPKMSAPSWPSAAAPTAWN
ncbi:MAG: hypothetical protein R2867_45600 [Caldilineaceae bacterium]